MQPDALISAPAPSGLAPLQVLLEALQEWIDADFLRHFELVQSGATSPEALKAAITLPGGWEELETLMNKLVYRLEDVDPWTQLGFGPLRGPEPTERDILSRVRLGRLLLDLGTSPSGPVEDQARAKMQDQLKDAGGRCEAGLADVRASRRKLRPDRLPQWKELGGDAIEAIRAILDTADFEFINPWPQVLHPLGDHRATIARHRRLSDLLEKGDARFLQGLPGRRVLAWAPAATTGP